MWKSPIVGCKCCGAPDLQLHDGRCRRRRWLRTPVLFSSESVSLGRWEVDQCKSKIQVEEWTLARRPREAARQRVAKWQLVLDVLGETSGPEVDGLLARPSNHASHKVQEFYRPCQEACSHWMPRELRKRASLASEVDSCGVSCNGSAPGCDAAPDASSEVLQLREVVSQLQAQIRGPRPSGCAVHAPCEAAVSSRPEA